MDEIREWRRTKRDLQGLSLYVSSNPVRRKMGGKGLGKNNNPTDQKCAEF